MITHIADLGEPGSHSFSWANCHPFMTGIINRQDHAGPRAAAQHGQSLSPIGYCPDFMSVVDGARNLQVLANLLGTNRRTRSVSGAVEAVRSQGIPLKARAFPQDLAALEAFLGCWTTASFVLG